MDFLRLFYSRFLYKKEIINLDKKIVLITNQKNWLEHTALTQLQKVANLKGVVKAVGLPDLHAGKSPIGIVLKTEGILYPHIVGNDIGCGMGLFQTGIKKKQYKQERWLTKLNHIKSLEKIPVIHEYEQECPIYDLGTLGGGNHFAEFQVIDSIEKEADFGKLGIENTDIMLLVHCGSRGYGQQILKEFLNFDGLEAKSPQAEEYIAKHDTALVWAQRNRLEVAYKLTAQLGYDKEPKKIIDCMHNYLEKKENCYIHRKGAVSAQCDFAVIPGTRGSLTYLVKPGKNTAYSLDSLSHGAGRKWARSLCYGRMKEKYTTQTVRETALKSRVVCHDSKLLFEEAPEAYKNISHVIDSLLEYELIEVVATLKPLITVKV